MTILSLTAPDTFNPRILIISNFNAACSKRHIKQVNYLKTVMYNKLLRFCILHSVCYFYQWLSRSPVLPPFLGNWNSCSCHLHVAVTEMNVDGAATELKPFNQRCALSKLVRERWKICTTICYTWHVSSTELPLKRNENGCNTWFL